jgi:hypothetical protein
MSHHPLNHRNLVGATAVAILMSLCGTAVGGPHDPSKPASKDVSRTAVQQREHAPIGILRLAANSPIVDGAVIDGRAFHEISLQAGSAAGLTLTAVHHPAPADSD